MENNIEFVDVIEALDQDRDLLISFVHINAEGNKIIAKAFSDKIAQYVATVNTGEATSPSNGRP